MTAEPGLKPPLEVLGVNVARVTMSQCLDLILGWCLRPGSDSPRTVFTANPEMIWASRRDGDLSAVLDRASLVVADGIGVVLASRILGKPVPERLPGIDILSRLLEIGRRKDLRPFFVGARPEVMDRLPLALDSLFPDLKAVGFHHGYFDLQDPDTVSSLADGITRSGANLLVSGMGVPRDQIFLEGCRGRLPGVGSAIGVGGSLDVMAGAVPRAPGWMRRAGLEWLYRLAREPSRLRRQAALPCFFAGVLTQAIGQRLPLGRR